MLIILKIKNSNNTNTIKLKFKYNSACFKFLFLRDFAFKKQKREGNYNEENHFNDICYFISSWFYN